MNDEFARPAWTAIREINQDLKRKQLAPLTEEQEQAVYAIIRSAIESVANVAAFQAVEARQAAEAEAKIAFSYQGGN